MDDEKNKSNNNPSPKPIDDDEIITDGFFDPSEPYSRQSVKSPAVERREAELRRRDEKRRALEMRAIKEDIERRYSLQLENAQTNAESGGKRSDPRFKRVLPKKIDERETLKEELARIDKIINSENILETPPEDVRSEESENSDGVKDEKQAFDLSKKNPLYALTYNYGLAIYRLLFTVFGFVFKLIAAPFIRLDRAVSRAAENAERGRRKIIRNRIAEIKRFGAEIRRAGKTLKRTLKNPRSFPSVASRYFKKARAIHGRLLKSAANVLLPVAAALAFVITINYWSGVTFALKVVYNDKTIGYISNEAVYIEAKNLVKERLRSGAYFPKTTGENAGAKSSPAEVSRPAPGSNLNAQYFLSLASRDRLRDAGAISDKIIENSADNLADACGIFVDGDFVCAVKNEADAKTVFYNILEPYEKDARENGYVADFAETIDYVQGLYSDDESLMWDAAKLSSFLEDDVRPPSLYSLSSGDSIESVARFFDVDEEYLERVNPSYDWDDAKSGDSVVVQAAKKLVNIRKIVTTSTVEEIKRDVVKKRDSSKYSGYTKVEQKGEDGLKRITKTSVYIDGIPQKTEYSYDIIREPRNKIIVVGTKTSFNGVYIGSPSKSGFLWPAPSCRCVSSPYGWRRSGWHNGIDLCKSGGGALGTPVVAAKAGRVEVVQRSDSGYGNMALINHGDGYKTRYAHMTKGSITVSVGDYVEAGQTIGRVGSTGNSTGPHLHFEVIRNGETQNPRNYIS